MMLTVILFTYNHNKFLVDAIESVLRQQTNFDFETWILDDCSNDGTTQIALAFEDRYPKKIHVDVAKKNANNHEQFMKVFEKNNSRYLAFLDGDDFWTSPHKLQQQVDFLERHPECSICFHNVRAFYEDGSQDPYDFNSTDQKEISNLDDLLKGNFIGGCSPLLRKDSIENLPEWFVPILWGDWALYLFASHHGDIGYINELMGAYRIHPGGAWSGRTQIQQVEETIKFYRTLINNLKCDCIDRIQPLIAEQMSDLAILKKHNDN